MNPKHIDLAAFVLSGNTLIKLVEYQVLSSTDALEVLERTRASLKQGDELIEVQIEDHLLNLKAKIEAC